MTRLLTSSTLRLPLLALLLVAAGCTWEGRPDGADAVHTDSDGYYDDRYGDGYDDGGLDGIGGVDATLDVPVVDPVMGDEALPEAGTTRDSPVPLDQPVPTTGPLDTTTETEEALTPGTEQ